MRVTISAAGRAGPSVYRERWGAMKSSRVMRATFAVLRIVVGLLLLQHGGQKLFGWFGGMGSSGATVELVSRLGLAGVLELGGGVLLVLGFLTRPVAFLLSGEMAVAYFTAHQPNGTWPIQNHGELAALYSFVLLFFAAHGAGAFSLDASMHRDRKGAGVVERDTIPVAESEHAQSPRVA